MSSRPIDVPDLYGHGRPLPGRGRAEAMSRPSGLTATVEFGLESCRISKLGFSAATSQTLTAGSEAPAEIRSGSQGERPQLGTGAGVGLNGWTSFPLAGS